MRITDSQRLDVEEVLEPLEQWAHKCHQASLAIVNARIFHARVARGFARGVIGQHSWVVVGHNVYRPRAIIDPTMWSYADRPPEVDYHVCATQWSGRELGYSPHGSGHIFYGPMPKSSGDLPIELEGDHSSEAQRFLHTLGPLDARGWMQLFNSPVEAGWPAREIITAAYRQQNLRAFIPVDIVGHITDENPGGLYLPTATAERERAHGN